MYKWDEMTPRERDCLVANKVMDRDDLQGVFAPRRGSLDDTFGRILPDGYHERTPNYSTDISAAWEIFQNIKERMFSKRQKFMKEIQLLISCNADLPIGHVIAWPEAFWWITPDLICRAALETVDVDIE